MIAIYVLLDPRTQEVRYVGKSKAPEVRLRRHLDIAPQRRSHCAKWIMKLHDSGLLPEMQVVCWVDDKHWQECERSWIKHYRDAGARLTNMTEGGEGVTDPSPEIRMKISKSIRESGFRPPNNRGKKYSPEARARMAAAKSKASGWVMSDALRAALAKGQAMRKVTA